MKIISTFILILFSVAITRAQVIITISSVSSNTPVNDTLYLAGNFNNWNAKSNPHAFTKNGNTYTLTIANSTTPAEYKITRGSWATVEGDKNGNFIPNRTMNISVPNSTQTITVEGWEDLKTGGGNNSTAAANVKILNNAFWIPQLNTGRKVWIYLPKDYETNTQKKYPVMYMHDGQNCFDKLTAFAGEWGVDETLNAKQNNGDYGCIVVAIDNGGASRLDEYSPYVNKQYGGGKGNQYVDFIVNTLKPYIDSAYRTLNDQPNTAIAGSSMGGLISMYAMVKYPNVFGKAGVFSPAFWFSDSLYSYIATQSKTTNQKIYFVCGLTEGSNMAKWQDSMSSLLQSKGYRNNIELKNVIKANGSHSESFWSAEFGACYDWLFANTTQVQQVDALENQISVYPNPSLKEVMVQTTQADILKISIFNAEGKAIQNITNHKIDAKHYKISYHDINSGVYFMQIQTNNGIVVKKLSLNQ
ncbi:MAG: alpha/beta hydrolase-fold protein [Bacteroidota bacterium]